MIELPAGLRAEHTIVHPGANGAVLVLGIEPLRIDGPPPGGGQVSITSSIQWTTAIHLPPAAMKHLRDQLIAVVDQWESQMGSITVLAPTAPKPTLAVFNPEVVRRTDQLSYDQVHLDAHPLTEGEKAMIKPHEDLLDRATAVADRTRQDFQSFYQRASFDSEGRPDRRPRSDECPPDEPEPSPSEPTP